LGGSFDITAAARGIACRVCFFKRRRHGKDLAAAIIIVGGFDRVAQADGPPFAS